MHRKISRAVIIAVALALVTFGAALAIIDSAVVDGYKVDLVSIDKETASPNWIWTYAITAPPCPNCPDVSHWTLAIGDCGYVVVAPEIGSNYTTPTDLPECSTDYDHCTAGTYNVVYGPDGTTGISGIKFEFLSGAPLGSGIPQPTQIFQFELANELGHHEGDTDVLVKAGAEPEIGQIHGPVCGPTAVSLASFAAESQQSLLGSSLLVVGLLLLLVVGGSWLVKRKVV